MVKMALFGRVKTHPIHSQTVYVKITPTAGSSMRSTRHAHWALRTRAKQKLNNKSTGSLQIIVFISCQTADDPCVRQFTMQSTAAHSGYQGRACVQHPSPAKDAAGGLVYTATSDRPRGLGI